MLLVVKFFFCVESSRVPTAFADFRKSVQWYDEGRTPSLAPKAGAPNLSPTMYPISISTDEYAPLKFLWQNVLSRLITDMFNNKRIMIFENNNHRFMYNCLDISSV